MKIGLVPIAAKPYHAGHHCLVNIAASENDIVRVFVSLADRSRPGEITIRGADMQRVWQEHIAPIMPGNVEVLYGGTPVRRVYEELQAAEAEAQMTREPELLDTYTVYSDPEDTLSNYSMKSREKYFPTLSASRQVVFAAEENPDRFTRGCAQGTPDVSGTKMRAAIAAGDFETFHWGMPPEVDARAVFDILSQVSMSENLLRSLIRSIL